MASAAAGAGQHEWLPRVACAALPADGSWAADPFLPLAPFDGTPMAYGQPVAQHPSYAPPPPMINITVNLEMGGARTRRRARMRGRLGRSSARRRRRVTRRRRIRFEGSTQHLWWWWWCGGWYLVSNWFWWW